MNVGQIVAGVGGDDADHSIGRSELQYLVL